MVPICHFFSRLRIQPAAWHLFCCCCCWFYSKIPVLGTNSMVFVVVTNNFEISMAYENERLFLAFLIWELQSAQRIFSFKCAEAIVSIWVTLFSWKMTRAKETKLNHEVLVKASVWKGVAYIICSHFIGQSNLCGQAWQWVGKVFAMSRGDVNIWKE